MAKDISYDLEDITNKLRNKSMTELVMMNSTIMRKREDNFLRLFAALYENKNLTNVSIINLSLRDMHCMVFMEALTTCETLETLDVQNNELSNIGIELIADMAEFHPTLKELNIENQHGETALTAEAEKALCNCISQNKNIVKLNYTFKDRSCRNTSAKLLKENNDYLTQIRNLLTSGKPIPVAKKKAYPYTKKNIDDSIRLKARVKLQAAVYKFQPAPAPSPTITPVKKLDTPASTPVTAERTSEKNEPPTPPVSAFSTPSLVNTEYASPIVVSTSNMANTDGAIDGDDEFKLIEEQTGDMEQIYNSKEIIKSVEMHKIIKELSFSRKSSLRENPGNSSHAFFEKGGCVVKYDYAANRSVHSSFRRSSARDSNVTSPSDC